MSYKPAPSTSWAVLDMTIKHGISRRLLLLWYEGCIRVCAIMQVCLHEWITISKLSELPSYYLGCIIQAEIQATEIKQPFYCIQVQFVCDLMPVRGLDPDLKKDTDVDSLYCSSLLYLMATFLCKLLIIWTSLMQEERLNMAINAIKLADMQADCQSFCSLVIL